MLLGELDAFEPSVSDAARACVAVLTFDQGVAHLDKAAFSQAAKISLDYAVMERTKKAAVVPASFSWSDLGAWDAIWDAAARDEAGNAVFGDGTLIDSHNVLIRSTVPFVGVIGCEDLVVVAEPDAMLVCRRDASQAVNALVDGLKRDGRSIASGRDRSDSARRILAGSGSAQVEQWTLKAGEIVELPVGAVQVLDGTLEGVETYAAFEIATTAATTTAATLLVTRRL